MANRMLGQECFDLKNKAISHLHDFFLNSINSDISAIDLCDEIPTIDYSLLFSENHDERAKSLEHLGKACQEFGFFYYNLDFLFLFFFIEVDKWCRTKCGRRSTEGIRWGLRSHAGENREYLKIVAHPEYHCPSKPASFRGAIGEYFKRMHEVELGLAKAISKILGYEETYIEKEFKLEAGFDVSAMNLYPPSFQSKGSIGVPEHTDPGFFVSLIQDVNGGLQMLTHKGNWVTDNIPRNAIFINLGDHLEVSILILDNNEVNRISMATLHGPSLDIFVAPASRFIDESHPPAYRGMTYKESLELNGSDEIDVQSSLSLLRIPFSL
ncbi:hypothetical protein ERO13_D03G070102v2 [Gossypium hirsutum]|nr:hypothetical protein ERO13_D03G070102v2 [Gossypium hirsutum]